MTVIEQWLGDLIETAVQTEFGQQCPVRIRVVQNEFGPPQNIQPDQPENLFAIVIQRHKPPKSLGRIG